PSATLRAPRVFSSGLPVPATLAALLLVVFRGEPLALIPLYAVGVFISFALSQSGMVRRWWRMHEPGWHRHIAVNGVGALATGVVAIVIAMTKFTHGAWIVIVVIPVLVLSFVAMRRHYDDVAHQLSLENWEGPSPMPHTV